MTQAGPETLPIQVAASIIADISTGIYRTPANALKELVSNSFDADATEVVISTGYPDFRTMTCTDDGDGMTAEGFKGVMGYIGGTAKRAESDITPRGRPKIGKIGIGILAVAEICTKFRVFSSVQDSPRKFEAEVDLKDFTRPDVMRKHLGDEEIGHYWIVELAERPEAHYTTVVMEDVKPDFREALVRSAAEQAGIVPASPTVSEDRFRAFVEGAKDSDLLRSSEYRRLLWELSLVTPVPYFDEGAFRDSDVMAEKLDELRKYNFKVVCDGFELRKPILLPTDPELTEADTDFKTYPLKHSAEIEKRRLRLTGYLFHQRTQVRPSQLQGVLLRVRNVAIGDYDRSLLGFPGVPGPMTSQITGEIYVESGLEEAMNIDRASFRQSDALYRELQRFLFSRLGAKEGIRPGAKDLILQDIRRRSRERMVPLKEQRARQQAVRRLSTFARRLTPLVGQHLRIEPARGPNARPITFDPGSGVAQVWEDHPMFKGPASKQLLLKQFLIGYEVANTLKPGDTDFLLDVLRRV